MKLILFTVLVLISHSIYADHVDKIKNWDPSIVLNQEQVIEELEQDTGFWYFVGDDGVECEGQIYALELTNSQANNEHFIVEFEVKFDAEVYGSFVCFERIIECKAKYKWSQDLKDYQGPKTICQ